MRTVTKETLTAQTPPETKPETRRQDPTPGELSPEDLAAINALSRRTLTPDQVYTFAVRLCDNRTDRDMEYFDRAALETLAQLFVGKTGIFDHSWSAKDQTARIYRTEVLDEPGVVTEAGEPGCCLKGYAYMLRTPENAGLRAEIEGGIKKEVSVSCAVSRCVCSVCGNDIADQTLCSHVKGRIYEGKRCIVKLEAPTDAYEWSFVAVPAQPLAGVVKGFAPAGGSLAQLLEKTAPHGQWREELSQLEKEAAAGRAYLDGLRQETVRLGLLADPAMAGDVLRSITAKLDGQELEALRTCYQKRLEDPGRPLVQLPYGRREERPQSGDDQAFHI